MPHRLGHGTSILPRTAIRVEHVAAQIRKPGARGKIKIPQSDFVVKFDFVIKMYKHKITLSKSVPFQI